MKRIDLKNKIDVYFKRHLNRDNKIFMDKLKSDWDKSDKAKRRQARKENKKKK